MFYGDSVITPAISVLSAVEGLEVVSPHFTGFVIPLTLAVLIVLFAVQRSGTARVGSVFGPIMVLWFAHPGYAGQRCRSRAIRACWPRSTRYTPSVSSSRILR